MRCVCGACDCRRCFPYSYDVGYSESCHGPADACVGCEMCTAETKVEKIVIARKARDHIKPGDRVLIIKGFTYQINGGPRLEYFTREIRLGGAR